MISLGLALAAQVCDRRSLLGPVLLIAGALAAGLRAAARRALAASFASSGARVAAAPDAVRAEAAKGELFLMITHDMRGSLSVVEAVSDILGDLPDVPDEAVRYARLTRSAGRALNGIASETLRLKEFVLRDTARRRDGSDTFLTIARSMRGPLAVIQGGSDNIVRLPRMPEKAMQYARAMSSAACSLSGMVQDILNLNKMESGNLLLEHRPFSVKELLSSQVAAHQAPAEMLKMTLSAAPMAEDVVLTANRPLLERVLTNLIGNALKFAPRGGRIEVSCAYSDAGQVLFCVADNGPGIPADKRDFVFQKFGQLDPDKSRGFGLGLALCKMVVELHQGRIWVSPGMDGGSRFLFTVSRRLKARGSARNSVSMRSTQFLRTDSSAGRCLAS